jgi:lactoylglutathione lyase
MRIEHIAIWTRDIELLSEFYAKHFGCMVGERYTNVAKSFCSRFLRFEDGARLEVMQVAGLGDPIVGDRVGLAHIAVSVGSEEEVVRRTEAMREAGVRVVGEPRRTGDGYFESVVLDPDGNRIEITYHREPRLAMA